MKIAILLRGQIRRMKPVFTEEFYYTKTVNSFINKIKIPLEKNEHKIDIYASIKSDNISETENFVKDYGIAENKYIVNSGTNQYQDILNGLNLINNAGDIYDATIITRVDLLYKNEIVNFNIDYSKFNICWAEPDARWHCDNFYVFSQKYIKNMIDILNSNRELTNYVFFGQLYIYNLISENIKKDYPEEKDFVNLLYKNRYYSGTNWINKECDNPIYRIYGYEYHFDTSIF